jgi:dGTPase
VCHDFEDAVQAGVVSSDDLPPTVRATCGAERGTQIATFVGAVIDTITGTGMVGMADEPADALATFRAFNHERIYLRSASVAQAEAVIRLLRALVEHLVEQPHLLPESGDDSDPTREAVAYVAGMTDRYACRLAVRELSWPLDQLPRGFDLFG